jgi:hypothetical protein
MKTTIFQSVFCILVVATTVLSSCNKEEPIVSGLVSGTVSVKSGQMNVPGTPLSGVKLYLYNPDFKADTVNYENNTKAKIDSTETLSNGSFSIDQIQKGNYAILPALNYANQRFVLADNSDSLRFTVNDVKKDFKVNFLVTPIENSSNEFCMRFVHKNSPPFIKITFRRTHYEWFGPNYRMYPGEEINTWNRWHQKTGNTEHCFVYGGGFWPIDLLTNEFTVSFIGAQDDFWLIIYKDVFDARCEWPVGSTPAYSTFEVDWEAKTFKWIKNSY